jgi:phosphatidylglycerol:prolipoprotein diacylglycerol transferase
MSLYGFIIGLGILLSFSLFQKRQTLLNQHQAEVLIIGLFLASTLGARIYHIVDYWWYYSRHLWQIFNLRAGGLGIYGAIALGLFYLYVFCRYYSVNFHHLLDQLAPFVPLTQAIGRFGNYFNQENFGPPTTLPWGQFIPINLRPTSYQNFSYFHPTWLYEAILNFVLFFYISRYPNRASAKFFIGYGIIRLLTETLRINTWQIDGFKIAYLASIIIIVFGLSLLYDNPTLKIVQKYRHQRPLQS